MVSILALMVIPLTVILRGLVLSIAWSWFFVEALGLPQINVAQAIGISMVVAFLTKDSPVWNSSDTINKELARIEGLSEEEQRENQKKAAKKFLETIKNIILHSLTFLLLAWIIHQFV